MLVLFVCVLVACWISLCLFCSSPLEQWEPCECCLPSCSFSTATCSLEFRIQTAALSPASQTCRGIYSSHRNSAEEKLLWDKVVSGKTAGQSKCLLPVEQDHQRLNEGFCRKWNHQQRGGVECWADENVIWNESHVKKEKWEEFLMPESTKSAKHLQLLVGLFVQLQRLR